MSTTVSEEVDVAAGEAGSDSHEVFYAALTARNGGLVDAHDQRALRQARILVAGCDSIGGAVVEPLVRLGAEHLVLAEPDGYEVHNSGDRSSIFNVSSPFGRGFVHTTGRVLECEGPQSVRRGGRHGSDRLARARDAGRFAAHVRRLGRRAGRGAVGDHRAFPGGRQPAHAPGPGV